MIDTGYPRSNMMEGYSPKSSPQRGGNGGAGGGIIGGPPPSANAGGGGGIDQSGPLKMKLQLHPNKQQPSPFHFYLMRPDSIVASEVTGATNLMASKNLEQSYTKLVSKKMKDSLSSFLPQLPGVVDAPGSQDNSSLRGLIDKPPVGGKELVPLNQLQLSGFRLHPGPLPEQYRALLNQVPVKEKKRAKKRKHRGSETPAHEGGGGGGEGRSEEDREKRREKKHKRHDKETEERKKKKKEKKKKRNKEDKDT